MKRASKPNAQALALDKGHCIEGEAFGFARGEYRHDVRMVQPGRDLDLALEPVDAHPGSEVWWQDLYHDLPIERLLLGDEHAGHPASAQFSFEGIGVPERGLELLAKVGGQCLAESAVGLM